MADRLDYYYRQLITEAELDLGFALLEQADHDLATDLGIYGIVSGGTPGPHAPVPDLSVDFAGPARAYDNLGQRIFFGVGQTVDCTSDLDGIPTTVSAAGKERWLGIFIRFTRLLSDPRTDGNSQQIFFRRDESFEIVIRQGLEQPVGLATKVALQPDELLLCDVKRRFGQTQIVGSDIDQTRRQVFIFAQASAIAVQSGLWSVLTPTGNTAQLTFDDVDAKLRDHFNGSARRHNATAIDYVPHGFLAQTNVQSAVNELVDDLSSSVTNSAGAGRIGADVVSGAPNALSAGTVDSQLSALLGFLNTHVSASTGAHNASAIAALVHNYITSTNVQSQLQDIVAALLSTASSTAGASRVGVGDPANKLNATTVEAAFTETLEAFDDGHFRGNETNAGQHRAIIQPPLTATGGKVVLLDSSASNSPGTHLRIIADSDSVYLLMNTSWNGTAWARDSTSWYCGGMVIARDQIQFLHENTFAATFTTWTRTWTLPMSSTSNNSSFNTTGTIQETGNLGLDFSNTSDATKTVSLGTSNTFRTTFANTPSSITFTATTTSGFTSGATPTLYANDRYGFAYYRTQSIPPNTEIWWYGNYNAIA